jgi:hypothetical protein
MNGTMARRRIRWAGPAIVCLLLVYTPGSELLSAREAKNFTAIAKDAAAGPAAPIDKAMAGFRRFASLPGFDPARLSAANRNLFSLAERWPAVRTRLMNGAALSTAMGQISGSSGATTPLKLGTNLSKSRFSGFTQSETATAWCGRNAVMGFNDTGAEVATLASGRGVSMDGYAVSSDHGSSFTYMGSPATPADPNTFMSGDPDLDCADPETFYYVSSFLDGTNAVSGVGLSISNDGGQTFAQPDTIAGASSDTHIIDGPWLAVDHFHPNFIYLTYTNIDFSGAICGFESGSPVPRYAIELVASGNAGASWSDAPVVIAQVCADSTHPFAFVGGSRVSVARSGKVYVAWELFGNSGSLTSRQIEMSSSNNQGQSFSTPVIAATIACAGDCADLQGMAHSNEHPSLAVGKGPRADMVYLAWNDGDRQAPDTLTTIGAYNFTDIEFSQSADEGVTWSAPVRVNNNPEGGQAPLTDQFEPAMAADVTGRIAICFYDRRRDPDNFRIDRFCASSSDGITWNNVRITYYPFPPIVGQDLLLAPDYMGDYDTLTSDALNHHTGFVGGFGCNLSGNAIVKTIQY